MAHTPPRHVVASSLSGGPRRARCRGSIVAWVTGAAATVGSMSLLAVDFGRVTLARQQAQAAVDAAVLGGCAMLANDMPPGQVRRNTARLCNENLRGFSGDVAKISQNDVSFGTYDPETKVFTAGPYDPHATNAVRLSLDAGTATLRPMLAQWLGASSVSVPLRATAAYEGTHVIDHRIESTFDIFLAGAAPGTVHQEEIHPLGWFAITDIADLNAPAQVDTRSRPIRGGTEIRVDVDGWVRYNESLSPVFPDGWTDWDAPPPPDTTLTDNMEPGTPMEGMGYGRPRYEPPAGIASIVAPYGSTVGLFLGPGDPASHPTPDMLRFDNAASLNFDRLEPGLRQPFFIGDGRNDAGDLQTFVAPDGATRLYLATYDWFQYNDNTGAYTSAGVHVGKTPMLVD